MCASSAESASSSCATRSGPPRSPRRRSSAASGCARSGTSSTPCRRTSPTSATWPPSAAPSSAPSPRCTDDPLPRAADRMSRFLDHLAAHAAERERRGLTRHLVPRRPDAAATTDTTAEPLDLAGNDYLGLLRRPDIVAGAVAAAQAYGGGAGASRLVTGTLALHEELELGLARLLQADSALVFSTGYAANLGAVTALTDADTLLVSDAHVHASLIDAARLSRARVAVVAHDDVAA